MAIRSPIYSTGGMVFVATTMLAVGVVLGASTDDFEDLPEWVQAATSIAALIGVFIAAQLPIKAQERERARVEKLRADALAALLLAEVASLTGRLDRAMSEASPANMTAKIPPLLAERIDHLYLLGLAGPLLIEAVGMISAAQVQAEAAAERVGTVSEEAALKTLQREILEEAKKRVDAAFTLLKAREHNQSPPPTTQPTS